jgi:DNA-binding NarL/FixJ family response regulator
MRILIVDDQGSFRTGLRALLSTVAGIEVVGEAENGQEAIAAAERLHPDLILMDARMPVLDGIAATAAIRARDPHACVLVLTTFDEDEIVVEAIRAGAAGYLLKGTPIADMAEIFALALRGYTALGPGIARRALLATPSEETVVPEELARVAELSEREREILTLIAQGLTNREVAARLFLSEGTVKNYASAILATLRLRHRTEAALLWRALSPHLQRR